MKLLLILACFFTAQGQEQDPEPETDAFSWARSLDELDLSITTGDFEFLFSGELTLEAYVFGDVAAGITLEQGALRSDDYNKKKQVDNPEFGGNLRFFFEGFYQDWAALFVEVRADVGLAAEEGEGFDGRFEQYWLTLTPPDQTYFNIRIGKFPAPMGNFSPRHSARLNPLTTYPMPYDHVTTFMYNFDDEAVVLGRREKDDVKFWRVPILQANYGTGVVVFGGIENFHYAVALTNSAPATWAWDWEWESFDHRNPNLYLRAGYFFEDGPAFGVSWSRGPYEKNDAAGIPPGRDNGDFPQTMAGFDFEIEIGDIQIFAEIYWSRFKGSAVEDDLDLFTFYVEVKVPITSEFFVAARIGQMRFGDISGTDGVSHRWDKDTTRYELGAGYFFTRNFFIKSTIQINEQLGGKEPDDNMWMTQVGLTF